MNKLLLVCSLIIVFGCKKKEDTVEPVQQPAATVNNSPSDTNNPVSQEMLFESLLDDSLILESDTFIIIDSGGSNGIVGYLYYDTTDFLQVRAENIAIEEVVVGSYMNQHLISNSDCPIDITHYVYVGDGSKVGILIGSSSTQINSLEITKVENDRVWIEFDVDWHYTHWLYTEKNKSGTIVGEINGLKYR